MRISTVKGIGEMPIGTKLEGMRGKITAIFEQKSGNNEHGDWSMQTVGFQDATGKIDLLLKDREPLHTSWKGKTVLIQAGEYKGKPSGIEIDQYKEKTRIKVTPSAEIVDGEESGAPAQQRGQAQRPATGQQQPQSYQEEEHQEQQKARPANQQQQRPQQQQHTQQQQTPEEYIKETKMEVMRLAHLYTVCHDASVFHASSVYARHGFAPHPASIGALATTLFIESNKKHVGAKLPACDLTKLPAPHFKMIEIVEAYEQREQQANANQAPQSAGLEGSPDRW